MLYALMHLSLQHCAIAQWFEDYLCAVDSNPEQLSCPVGRELALTAECRGFESHPGQLFFSLKRKSCSGCKSTCLPCLASVPCYQVVETYYCKHAFHWGDKHVGYHL